MHVAVMSPLRLSVQVQAPSAIVSIKRYHCEDITVPSWTPNSPDAMGGQAALSIIHKEGACVSCISRVKEASWD